MQFMALIYGDEGAWETLTDEERQSVYARYQSLAEDARAAGVMRGGDELASTRDATTVRIREGQTLVVDGPYAETKELIGGLFLTRLPDLDEAIRLASIVPAAEYGSIEIRPVVER